ncbi:hypothetical protein VCJ_001518 [Vibrio metoecus]|nr:hypothetical protein VCJ_001518 [Vibrio metoecus]
MLHFTFADGVSILCHPIDQSLQLTTEGAILAPSLHSLNVGYV